MRFIVIFVVFVLTVLPTFAAQLELDPIADAFICDCEPNTTNPGIGNVGLAQGQPLAACYDQLYIEFDMSEIPAGETITAAELKFYCYGFFGAQSGEMTYDLIAEDWNENTITYNNRPNTSSAVETVTGWPTTGTWFSADVTEFVQAWYNGTEENYGFHGHSQNTTGVSMSVFHSSNHPTSSTHPYLIVEYLGSAIEDASLGETKAEFK